MFKESGKATESEAEFRKALAIRQKLADDDPAVTEFRRLLAQTHKNLGILLEEEGNLPEAEAEHQKALTIRQKLADDNPGIFPIQRDLARSLDDIGCKLAQAGRMGDAIGYYTREEAIWKKLAEGSSAQSPDGANTFRIACCHAGLAGLAGRRGSGVSNEVGAEWAEKAMTGLRQAVAMGYRNPEAFRSESALDALRNRPDFQTLMMDLAIDNSLKPTNN